MSDAPGPQAAAVGKTLSAVTGSRKAFLGLIDKLFQHLANIGIGLRCEQDAIALQTRAVGFGIVGDEAFCHAFILAGPVSRVTLGRQRR